MGNTLTSLNPNLLKQKFFQWSSVNSFLTNSPDLSDECSIFILTAWKHQQLHGTVFPLIRVDGLGTKNRNRSGFYYHMGNRWETVEIVSDFILGGSKITADGDCSHEIKRHLLLGTKVITKLDSMLKSRDITLPTRSI